MLTPLAKQARSWARPRAIRTRSCATRSRPRSRRTARRLPGGKDINAKDYAFAATIYPKPGPRATRAPGAAAGTVAPIWTPIPLAATLRASSGAGRGRRRLTVVVLDGSTPRRGEAGSPRGPAAEFARVFASYGGARVTQADAAATPTKGEPPTRFGEIIDMHERIKAYTNREHGTLPNDAQMIAFGDRSVRDAVPGRRAAPVRRGALAPAGPQARLRADVDGPVDRREALGVRLRPSRATAFSPPRRSTSSATC